MRDVKYLIEDVREQTENEIFTDSDNTGISDNEFLRFLNDAQYRLHSVITQKHPSVFITTTEPTVVPNQESYTLPSNIYINNKVSLVEFSPTTNKKDYYVLEPSSNRYRSTAVEGDPDRYIRQAGAVLLAPVPTSAGSLLRISYIRRPIALDIKRASIASVTLDTNNNTITALSFDVSTDSIDSAELEKNNFFTIVDRNGNIKMKDIEYDNISTSDGVITVTSSFTFESGETIDVGDYVVRGKYASTHSEFPASVERYLIAYAAWKILKRDSSADYSEQQQELLAMEDEIVQAYSDISDDITPIPELENHWIW